MGDTGSEELSVVGSQIVGNYNNDQDARRDRSKLINKEVRRRAALSNDARG
jgi:hypothetical protein